MKDIFIHFGHSQCHLTVVVAAVVDVNLLLCCLS